ncbi:MAG: F0F1 ATP synthase subunit alpha [Wigglesworthia glossinidia]|nr:F0F1 ATP synthase subunit alpha [Wigglesworthia glossinidia]
MILHATEISELIKKRIAQFEIKNEIKEEGIILSVSDGIIKIYGLSNIMQGEMIRLPYDGFAIALNLEHDLVGAIVLGSYFNLKEGMKVYATGRILEVPVGNELLGRVINTLGYPIDGKGEIICKYFAPVEAEAPGVIDRKSVNEPLYTGYKAIDAMIPIGKGQRELIIGDRQTGKSTLAIDIIMNQKNNHVKCIYVSIGQKASTVVKIVEKLKKYKALSNTIIVSSSASDAASLQYLAPYAGCAMGEYFRNLGEDALIVYDDLSKQAIAYRQISLLLKRPPGREAYPGDIFYLHSRLLERSACVNHKYIEHCTKNKIKNKSGSLTALPIVETQGGDISAFVPTNLISITDGQIFLESNLFNSGIRPAINPGISVSRVGGAAQIDIMRKLSGNIRTALAQYNELASFSQFSSDLDKNTKNQLIHGKKIVELLKQKQNAPISIENQVLLLFAMQNNYLNNIDSADILKYEEKLLFYAKENYPEFMKEIYLSKIYSISIQEKLKTIMDQFKFI